MSTATVSIPDASRVRPAPAAFFAFVSLAAAIVLGGVAVWMWIHNGPRLMWPPLQDDAYYYYVVAHNFAHGRGLTMDGALFTNGFQPLWFLIVLPIFALAPQRTDEPIAVVQAVSILLYAASAGLLGATATRLGVRPGLALMAALGVLLAPFVAHTSGMEGVITLPILLLTIRWLAIRPGILTMAGDRASAGDLLGLGVLLSLLMLGRLDSVFSILTLLAMLAISRLGSAGAWGDRVKRVLWDGILVCLPLGLLVGPYLLWNLATTGHMVPVSGALKSTFPHAQFQVRWLREFPHWLALLVPMGAWLCVVLFRVRGLPGGAARQALLPAVIGSFLHAAYTLFFCKWAVHGWHFALYIPPAMLCSAQLAQWLLDAVVPREPWRRGLTIAAVSAAVLAVGLSFSVSIGKVLRENEFRSAAYDGATWARQNTPPGTLFAMSDCGVFTYHSQRDCINLDGVINSWGFQDILASGRLGAYFRERDVSYLVSHWVPAVLAERSEIELTFPARLFTGRSSSVTVRRSDEVFRSQAYETDAGRGFLAVWRIAPD